VSSIRVGIGGWTFAPWRNNFFPKGLKQAAELSYASRHVSTIEINGTFYRTQSPATFRKWADETPDDFVFSVKAHRVTTNRKVLAEASESIEHFLRSGVLELGQKLGPVLWQFAPFKKFEPEDFEAFLKALPNEMAGLELRHVVEVRHASFQTEAFVALARRYKVAICQEFSNKYPLIGDVTADFIYARLQQSEASEEQGYKPADLDRWAEVVKLWAAGKQIEDVPLLAKPAETPEPRDCFVYFIAGAKERNPAAAMALMERL
jgi:uncharacterized protein YecE (DUF72 family)